MEEHTPSKDVPMTEGPSTSAAMPGAPFPDAPLCPDLGESHDNSLFHTLWDSACGCHYDHEHGQDAFTPEVAATFPGFDLHALLGGVGVGHTNPSSPMENTHKHGGFKWDVTLSHSAGCVGGEGATVGVDAAVIQYHAFGDYSIEFEARTHSALAVLRQCLEGNPTDYGYVFVNQLQDYGQRVAPYQGNVLPYPDVPVPAYKSNLKPYFSIDCTGGVPPCDKYPTLQSYVDRNISADSLWVSQPLHPATWIRSVRDPDSRYAIPTRCWIGTIRSIHSPSFGCARPTVVKAIIRLAVVTITPRPACSRSQAKSLKAGTISMGSIPTRVLDASQPRAS